jgi:hypothetical protein
MRLLVDWNIELLFGRDFTELWADRRAHVAQRRARGARRAAGPLVRRDDAPYTEDA